MRLPATILLLFLGIHLIFAQGYDDPAFETSAPPLSPYDSVMLSGLPELEAIPVLKSSELPYSLDNAKLPYYRPIYQQVSSECSQVSGIAYNFTYEINRLRDLPACLEENQYPPHFPFNFMSGGHGWHGVSYFHSFEILRALGCPSVEIYGGMAAGGDTRWMTGYNDYYESMKNRIRAVYQIKVGSPEGLMTLKHWLHNHLDGSATGGVASFYSNSPWNTKILAAGTPEAGRHVIVSWGGMPTHAMTIVGYNDSIRYDYNGDGMFSNDIDINEDGLTDMRDWEIGGLLFADGWGSGINFADSGKCFMMYKTLAEKTWEGGIWNHAVHVLDVKDLEKPLLTAKITLEHTRRGMLRVQCGVSSTAYDTMPEHIIEFPVFNFQGGSQYMQGGVSLEENKTIEFGLDITPLLGHLNTNGFNQFFLIVEERDADNLGAGRIMNFTVTDYSKEAPLEFYCSDLPIPITNNGFTYASLLFSADLDIMKVKTSGLPPAVVGEPYTFQMECEGGTPPYLWRLTRQCTEEIFQQEMNTPGTYMEPDNWSYGNIPYSLPFSLSLYEKYYDTIYIHPGGFIMFEDTQFPWPYLFDEQLLIRNTACIAPFLCRWLTYAPELGQGIWVHETEDQVSIRWKGDIDNSNYSPVVEFSLLLNANGEITFNYGTEIEARRVNWSCGVSDGNDLDYHFPFIEDQAYINLNYAVKLKTIPLPTNLDLSDDGLLSGIPDNYYQQVDLNFCVEDDDHIRAFKTLEFSATDLGIFDQDNAEGDMIESIFPNPFRLEVTIIFKPEMEGPLSCKVYSSSGQLVSILADKKDTQGSNMLKWYGHDASGKPCPAGIYFIHFQYSGKTHVRKIIYAGP